MKNRMFPSIWLGQFDSFTSWQSYSNEFNALNRVVDTLDDQLIRSRHPFTIKAWCTVCSSEQMMTIFWKYGGISDSGSINPPWTEISICPSCGFNSRMRALFTLLNDEFQVPSAAKIYISEQITGGYKLYKSRFPNLIGSEYLGNELAAGQESMYDSELVRHEDHTHLSFASASFDYVITQDVFEHIPDYKTAFLESRRVLNSNGCLIFSIPFFPGQFETEIRVRVLADGNLEHILPPEYHGNPLGGGSLCFQHFGWDMLDELRIAGFSQAEAHLYWGPWQGHFGLPFFIFSARV